MRHLLVTTLLVAVCAAPAAAAVSYVGKIEVSGAATDFAPGSSPNDNRLSFGSDLIYSQREQTFYGISDRGPGGGTIDFAPRIEAFKIDVNNAIGAVSNFNLTATKVLRQANGAT
jgi:hypothetical protein